ncbi:MAG: cobalamin B12-binding domain-containing protein [Actinomycetota bacterium]|nr:cobalamin B12-binding domain-containing protein [Actinomycetota bacterium]
MGDKNEAAVLRIGELSRRVGVSEHVLRAWESRYGLLRPVRSAGGYRLYSEDDQNRVRRMQAHLAGGLAAAEAAQAAIADEGRKSIRIDGRVAGGGVDAAQQADAIADSADGLRRALDEMDEPAAQKVLDRLLTDLTVESVLRDIVLPYLHDLGERWEQGVVSVAQEHFASHVIRGRLAGLARGWGNGRGPRALLACPPDEEHDMALLIFGIVLNRGGWRVEFLGGNTPIHDTLQVTSRTLPSLVVMTAHRPERFAAVVPELSALAELAPLVLAGVGATAELAQAVGARRLEGDPVTAAERLAGS